MTSNQIAYWKLQEEIRSNQVQETIKDRDVTSQIKRREVQNITDSINAGVNVGSAIIKSFAPVGKVNLGKLL